MSFANPNSALMLKGYENMYTWNQPRVDSRVGSEMWAMDVVVVPYWVSQALMIHKLNNIDLLDYVKLRKVLSLTDIARLCGVGDVRYSPFLTFPYGVNAFTLQDVWTQNGSLKGELLTEFQSTIMPLVHSDGIKQEVLELLSEDKEQFDVASVDIKDFYDIQTVQEKTIFVFVKRGIVNALGVRENAKSFISDYLRALYSLSPINEVSFSAAFRDYLDLL